MTPACVRAGSVTVASNSKIRVFKRRRETRPRGTRVESTYACLRSTGKTIRLDRPRGDEGYSYPPPALAVRGTQIAYAIDMVGDPVAGGDSTEVQVRDFGSAPSRPLRLRQYSDERVGSVRVSTRGGVTWIACQDDGLYEGTPRPGCVRAGARDSVYKRDSSADHAVELDHGRSIDPRSLRLQAGTITWTSGGRTRSAPLR